MDCLFCQLITNDIDYLVHEDKDFIVIPDRDSLGFGHCMIIPKTHIAKVYELDDATHEKLFRLAKQLATKLVKVTNKKAVAYISFGSSLPHAHLRLVPHDDIDVLVNPTKHVVRQSPEGLREMAEELKTKFAQL